VGAQGAGRLHDRGLSVPATGAALVLAFISLGLSLINATSIILVLVVVVLIDLAVQTISVLNQTRIIAVDPASRSRLNTAYVTCNFIGGAIGSALAAMLWQRGGWTAVMVGGCTLILAAFIVWLTQRRTFLAGGTNVSQETKKEAFV
jgi:predicted MFS family arabinose efflux permease